METTKLNNETIQNEHELVENDVNIKQDLIQSVLHMNYSV